MLRSLTMLALSLLVFSAGPVHAACVEFYIQGDFEQYCLTHGKLQKGVEDFEESNIAPNGKQPLPAPLNSNPNTVGGIGFPTGLTEDNIIIQDNVTPGMDPPMPNPSGDPTALYVLGPGGQGANSKKVGEDLFLQGIHASLDLIFTEMNHTGVGFDLSRFDGFAIAGWHITVYDKMENVIGTFDLPAPLGPEPSKYFYGIWCDETIGRINIFDVAGPEPDAIDNIQMWWEEPVSVDDVTWGQAKARYR